MTDAHSFHHRSRREVLAAGALAIGGATAGCAGLLSEESAGEDLPAPIAGDPDAAVTVAVFSDFACPHCATFHEETFPLLWDEYVEPAEIAYRHYDFPIPVDETVSWEAASAARSVLAQTDVSTFYDYVAALFDHQRTLGPDSYAEFAAGVGADGEQTRDDATSEAYRSVVTSDRETGRERGVEGTPRIFVEDADVVAAHGSYEYEAVAAEIDARL